MNDIQRALPNYLKILEKKKNGKSEISLLQNLAILKKPKFKLIDKNIFNSKIREGFKVLESCELCERKCKVDRINGKLGWCKCGGKMEISSYFEHLGEEYFFVPSFTIFFVGCTFSCQYCQNWEISQRAEKGRGYGEEELAEIIDEHGDCKNINFVGGEPTPYLPFILKTLKFVKADIPVVWNSNFYMSERSMDLLKGMVDVYLSDFKYGNNKCAERLSKVRNYFEIISRNHLLAFKDSELVIRHLVLPNHIECCSKPVLKWISENLGDKVVVNIMQQYHPVYKAFEIEDINRGVSDEEFGEVVDYAKRLGLNFIT